MGKAELRREIVLEGLLYLEPAGLLEWSNVFSRRAPVLIDIGAARARYFLNVGPHLPEVDLVGIEVAKKRVEKALEKLEDAGLGARTRMIWGDAVSILRDHVPEASVAAITVLFPDPWPKKRHAKRRIFQKPEVVDLLATRLSPGGLILLKTDARGYFEDIESALEASPRLARSEELLVRAEGFPPFSLDWPEETKYEAEFRSEGRPIHAAAFRRV